MRRLTAALLALAPLTLAACSTLSVESQASLPTGAPGFARTLVVVELSGESRRIAEEMLVSRLVSLHPETSYGTVALPPLIWSQEALDRWLGISESPSAAEEVWRFKNRRPSEWRHVEVKARLDDVDLRERARRDGFDGLLVVRLSEMAVRAFPDLEPGQCWMGLSSSWQIRTRTFATLTALHGDVEIWKGVVTNRDAEFPMSPRLVRKEATAFADHLREDGVAN